MKKFLWSIGGALLGLSLTLGFAAHAQVSTNYWLLSGGTIKPTIGTWTLTLPYLTNQNCVGTDATGKLQAGSCSGGAGFPFTPFSNYNSTSTVIGFLQGLFSNASSTFNGTLTAATTTAYSLNNVTVVEGVKYARTSAGITAALNTACPAGGSGSVFLSPGTYTISSNVVIPSNCDVYGNENATKLVETGNNTVKFSLISSSTLAYVTIDASAHAAGNTYGWYAEGVHDVTIDHVRVLPTAGFAGFLTCTATASTSEVWITNGEYYGLGTSDVIGGGGNLNNPGCFSDVFVSNNYIHQDSSQGTGHPDALNFVGPKNVQVTNNITVGGILFGTEVWPDTNSSISGNTVYAPSGTTTTASRAAVGFIIASTAASTSQNVSITNNTIYGGFVDAFNNSVLHIQDITISGNVIYATSTATSSGEAAIRVAGITESNITNNVIGSSTSDGIWLSSVTNTNISNNQMNDISGQAIHTTGTNSGNVYLNNPYTNATYAITTTDTSPGILQFLTGNLGIGTFSPGATLTVNGTASTTNLTVSGISSCNGTSALTTNTSGVVSCGAMNFSGFPFTPSTFGVTASNATSTLIGFNAGLYALASSTIGNGTQAGGLTILGGATTTGDALFASTNYVPANPQVTIAGSPQTGSNVQVVLDLDRPFNTGVFRGRRAGIAVGATDGTSAGNTRLDFDLAATGGLASLTDTTLPANTIMSLISTGLVGIGTTSPAATLGVQGNSMVSGNLTAGNLIATSTADIGTLTGVIGGNNGLLYAVASSSLFGFTPANQATTLTINGTSNQITSSAGSQDLSANRTWTLSFPSALQFPLSFTSTYGTTTFASSTALTATNLFSTNATSTNLAATAQGAGCAQFLTGGALTSTGVACGSGSGLTSYDAFTHPVAGTSATTTGMMLMASSTIGAGGQTTGLTVTGGATTTLNAYFGSKVGVGTTTPWRTFSITAGNSDGIVVNSTGNAPLIDLWSQGGGNTRDFRIAANFDASGIFEILGSTATNGNPTTSRLTIDSNGNVGIGTTTPAWLLNPYSNSASQIALSSGPGVAQWAFRNAFGTLYLSTTTTGNTATSTTAGLTITQNGQVSTMESALATSTSMVIDWNTTPNQVDVRIGTAAVTIGFNNASTSGMTKRIIVCNPRSTASTVTWSVNTLLWPSGTAPTQTTTADKCDVYSFITTQGTSTANSSVKVLGSSAQNF